MISSRGVRWSVLLGCALLIAGCAGMGTPYDSPAEAGQVPFKVTPITASLVRGVSVTRPTAAPPPASTIRVEDYVYRIGPGDVLSIFIDQPLFDAQGAGGVMASGERPTEALYVVSERGEIFLPLHGPLAVAGLTVTEAFSAIQDAILNFITRPQINVRVETFRSQAVTLATDSGNGTVLPIGDVPISIVDAVLAANLPGGSGAGFDLRQVVLKRNGNAYEVDVRALMESADFGRDWVLQAGDVVQVPDNDNGVFMLGEGPSARLPIDPYDSTLAEALVLSTGGAGQAGGGAAGGIGGQYLRNASTKLGSIFVIRGDTEFADVYHLNAKTPDAMLLADRFPLENGDIVFVTTREVTRFNRYVAELLPTIAPALFIQQITD